ncbi:laccase domain-containing protein [Candidatus Saccharibacteria bacterium]|jgi:copper oxidase (laccase) domain-containing protein|nr:laccase domain-containing protein [Candidatus Saccharibacteria bacterium]
MNVSEINSNSQFNANTQRTVDLLRPRCTNLINYNQLEYGINYFENNGFIFGQTRGINVQAIELEDGTTPQPGIVNFAHELGISQDKLVMPRLDRHTNKVLVIESASRLVHDKSQGRTVGYDPEHDTTYIDSLIVIESPETEGIVLGIHGADCPGIVGSGKLNNGNRFIFGLHAGRKGCLSGIIENTARELHRLGVINGSVRIAIGPGGQTLELPIETIQKEAATNQNQSTTSIWKESAVISYSKLSDRKKMVIYDNQADVIRRAQILLGPILAVNGSSIIDANTLTTQGLRSYRAMSVADNLNDKQMQQEKMGRNALFTFFN